MPDDERINQITQQVVAEFRTFGGGKKSGWGNPITEALKAEPPMFAAGVDVQAVVRFVLSANAQKSAASSN